MNKNGRRAIIVFAVIAISLLSPVGITTQKAHAVGPTVTQIATTLPAIQGGVAFSSSSVTLTTFNPSTYESQTLMLYSQCAPNTVLVSSITDSAGLAWKKIIGGSTVGDGTILGQAAEAWWVQVPASIGSSDSVVVNYSPSFTACSDTIVNINQPTFFDVATASGALSTASSFNHTSTGTSLSQTLVLQWTGDSYAFLGCATSSGAAYTQIAPLTDSSITGITSGTLSNCGFFNHLNDVFFASSGSSGPWKTTFACNNQCTAWGSPDSHSNYFATTTLTILLTLAPFSPIGKIVISPCTFFEFQCWWFPMFFNLTFGGIYLVVAFTANASTKAEIFMLLSGLSISGLISIILAILPITFPFLLILSHITYTLRLRGII